jgi:hypothetical protein
MHFMQILNVLLAKRKESRKRSLMFHVPRVVSLNTHVRLVQHDASVMSLEDIFQEYCQSNSTTIEQPAMETCVVPLFPFCWPDLYQDVMNAAHYFPNQNAFFSFFLCVCLLRFSGLRRDGISLCESGVRVCVWLGVGGCAPCRDAHKYFLDGTDSYSLRRQHLIKCREADKPVDDIRKEIFERIRKQVVHSDIFSRFMRATYVVPLPYVSHMFYPCLPRMGSLPLWQTRRCSLCDNHTDVPSVTTTPALPHRRSLCDYHTCAPVGDVSHSFVASSLRCISGAWVWAATHGG